MYQNYKISVVIATYNGEKYLEKQLDSIINQTVKPDEIIISDDVSKDKTVAIINEYVQKEPARIIFQRNKNNMGYTMNFLNALKMSSGDIVFLSDQDDEWELSKIKHMIDVMIKEPSIDVLSCEYDLIDGAGLPIRSKKNKKKNNNKNLYPIKWDNFVKRPANVPGMSLAIRRDIIEKIDLSTISDKLAHDWIINEIAAYRNGLYKYNEVLVHYRQHESNVVGVTTNYSVENLLKARKKILNGYHNIHLYLKKKYSSNQEIERLMGRLIEVDRIRINNLENKNLFGWFILFWKNYKLLSVINYCGDGVTIFKSIIK